MSTDFIIVDVPTVEYKFNTFRYLVEVIQVNELDKEA